MLSKNGDANEQKKNCADARRTCAENATNVVCDLLNEFGTQTIHTGPVGVCVAHNNTQTREQPRADSTLHILALKSVWILMEFYRGSHVFCLLLLLTGWTFYKYMFALRVPPNRWPRRCGSHLDGRVCIETNNRTGTKWWLCLFVAESQANNFGRWNETDIGRRAERTMMPKTSMDNPFGISENFFCIFFFVCRLRVAVELR